MKWNAGLLTVLPFFRSASSIFFSFFHSFFNPDFPHLSFSVVLYFSSSSVLLSLTVAVIFSVRVRFFSLFITLSHFDLEFICKHHMYTSHVYITPYIYSICIFFYIKRNITIWSCSLMVSVVVFFFVGPIPWGYSWKEISLFRRYSNSVLKSVLLQFYQI